MKILVSQAVIADPLSPFHNHPADVFIADSRIIRIADTITEEADIRIDGSGALLSPGWVDIFTEGCDPGYEHRETLESLSTAAVTGGFTRVFTLPNTQPVVDTKSQVDYIRQQATRLPVDIHPLGAITRGITGKDLSEMYDMFQRGAIAFSDGTQPVQSAGLFLKALQYVKAFDGVLIQLPQDKSIGAGGLMHEGIVSTRMGLPGIPPLAEELMVRRDIELLKYTQSKLHITGISTRGSLDLIRAARKEGLQISCSVTPYHLFFCDEDLQGYDTHLKVNPPLREKQDREALRNALLAGEIDCITSHHMPQDWDGKTCEFEYAKYGMIGLETAFSAVNQAVPGLSSAQIAAVFSGNARNIFGLPQTHVREGEQAELTLFSRDKQYLVENSRLKSKSANSPFIGKVMKGTVLAVIHKGLCIRNQ
ncbi:MAG TPA: dihydroorotase [Sediminibacterium sp.]|nr:dihydroorotase [Sediminibacterium sp.]